MEDLTKFDNCTNTHLLEPQLKLRKMYYTEKEFHQHLASIWPNMKYWSNQGSACSFWVFDKPVNDHIYVYRIFAWNHIATHLSVFNCLKSSEIIKNLRFNQLHKASRHISINTQNNINIDFWNNFLYELTADLPMFAWKELLTCQFCFQEQAKESHSRKVLSRAHVTHFEILEHCLYPQHLQHTCHCIHQLKETRQYKHPECHSQSLERAITHITIWIVREQSSFW